MRFVRAYRSGSCVRSHSTLGAVYPGRNVFPVSARTRPGPPSRSVKATHSAAVVVSFQSFAGRTGSPSASRQTRPCCCPETPMPATSTSLGILDAELRHELLDLSILPVAARLVAEHEVAPHASRDEIEDLIAHVGPVRLDIEVARAVPTALLEELHDEERLLDVLGSEAEV